jgi:hypothetical protein
MRRVKHRAIAACQSLLPMLEYHVSASSTKMKTAEGYLYSMLWQRATMLAKDF